jgi:hypothetical protein
MINRSPLENYVLTSPILYLASLILYQLNSGLFPERGTENEEPSNEKRNSEKTIPR